MSKPNVDPVSQDEFRLAWSTAYWEARDQGYSRTRAVDRADDVTSDLLDRLAENEPGSVSERLEYLRGEIRAERISYGEIAELQDLVESIDPGDVELLSWAKGEEDG